MPNVMNILAGLLSFIIGITMAYSFWQPIMNYIDYFPGPLKILSATMWVGLLFVSIVIFPIIMFVSDDKGQ